MAWRNADIGEILLLMSLSRVVSTANSAKTDSIEGWPKKSYDSLTFAVFLVFGFLFWTCYAVYSLQRQRRIWHVSWKWLNKRVVLPHSVSERCPINLTTDC